MYVDNMCCLSGCAKLFTYFPEVDEWVASMVMHYNHTGRRLHNQTPAINAMAQSAIGGNAMTGWQEAVGGEEASMSLAIQGAMGQWDISRTPAGRPLANAICDFLHIAEFERANACKPVQLPDRHLFLRRGHQDWLGNVGSGNAEGWHLDQPCVTVAIGMGVTQANIEKAMLDDHTAFSHMQADMQAREKAVTIREKQAVLMNLNMQIRYQQLEKDLAAAHKAHMQLPLEERTSKAQEEATLQHTTDLPWNDQLSRVQQDKAAHQAHQMQLATAQNRTKDAKAKEFKKAESKEKQIANEFREADVMEEHSAMLPEEASQAKLAAKDPEEVTSVSLLGCTSWSAIVMSLVRPACVCRRFTCDSEAAPSCVYIVCVFVATMPRPEPGGSSVRPRMRPSIRP